MIPRRLIRHLKDQSWFAAGLDLVIVVLGVFIGIQVSNWNDARLGAEQQQRYLERLAADFRSIQQRIDAHFVTFEGIIAGADYIRQLLALSEAEFREFAVDQQRLQDAASLLDHTRIPPGSSSTYLEMVSAGQLSALGNPVLRDKTATRNNYGLRRLEARLVDEILALLDAETSR